MSKRSALSTSRQAIHVARDPHPASAALQEVIRRRLEIAKAATDAIKAKRPAA